MNSEIKIPAMFDKQVLSSLMETGYATDLAQALEVSNEARIICTSRNPYVILFANKSWTKLTNFEQHEVIGESLFADSGPFPDPIKTKELLNNARIDGYHSTNMPIMNRRSQSLNNCSLTIRPVIETTIGLPMVSFYLITVTKFPTEIDIQHYKHHHHTHHTHSTHSTHSHHHHHHKHHHSPQKQKRDRSISSNSSLTESNPRSENNDTYKTFSLSARSTTTSNSNSCVDLMENNSNNSVHTNKNINIIPQEEEEEEGGGGREAEREAEDLKDKCCLLTEKALREHNYHNNTIIATTAMTTTFQPSKCRRLV